jgi:2-iminobutanoate/2-iminopropanoate deaminase
MQKSAVFGASGPLGGAPYSPAVRATGELLFISGQLGLDPETKKPYESFEAQVEGALLGLRGLVEAAGGTLDNIVKTTVFLSGDLSRFPILNEIYARHFIGEVRPARSTFAVSALPAGALVEIEAIAVL